MTAEDKAFRSATDRDFDDLAHRFKHQIYGNLKGRIRLDTVQRDLHQEGVATGSVPLNVLDAGGGAGQFSSLLAQRGHRITLADPSGKMLQLAKEHYAVEAPNTAVVFHQGSVQQLPDTWKETFDLVLFHAVLEWLVEPQQTLQQLLEFIKPGGHLSLLFYNKQGLVMRHLTLGNFHYVEQGYLSGRGRRSLTPLNPQIPSDVIRWFDDRGYKMLSHSGVRCFYDFMAASDRERMQDDDILRMELSLSQQDPYRELARYIHLLMQKPE